MSRKLLAVIVVVMFASLGTARGQDERSAVEHAMEHAHSDAEHGAHGEHMDAELPMDEDMPSENFLMWLISALGWKYMLLLPASALLSFVLTAVLVVAGKGRTTGAALAFIVAIPFLIGLFGMFDGLMASFMVIARSPTYPKPSVIAAGVSMSIVTPLLGMLLMVPSYLLATVGLSVRALQSDPKPKP